MTEMFRIVFAQIRGLNFHTKPAATTVCDTFSLFPRTVSFSTAHGLREGILNPNIRISSTCELPVFTYHTHSSCHSLSHPPAQHSSMSPQRCSMGVSHCWRTSQWPQSSRDTASGCVSTPTVRLHHCSPNPLGSMQKRKDIMRQSPSGWQDEVLEWSRKEKPLNKQQQRERKRSETTGTPITTVRVIYRPLLWTGCKHRLGQGSQSQGHSLFSVFKRGEYGIMLPLERAGNHSGD